MWETILNILLAIVSVALAGITYYLDIKKKLLESANKEIANAQDVTTDNKERMTYVVGKLKSIVPIPLRFIFTEKVIEKLAQAAFDKIKEYATKHAEENSKKATK